MTGRTQQPPALLVEAHRAMSTDCELALRLTKLTVRFVVFLAN